MSDLSIADSDEPGAMGPMSPDARADQRTMTSLKDVFDETIFGNDPVLRIVVNRFHLPGPILWLLASLVPTTGFACLAALAGELRSHGEIIGFLHDFNLLNGLLLGVPATCLFYCLFPTYLRDCLIQLFQNGVIKKQQRTQEGSGTCAGFCGPLRKWVTRFPWATRLIGLFRDGAREAVGRPERTMSPCDECHREFLRDVARALTLKGWTVISIACAGVFTIVAAPLHMGSKSWLTQHWFSSVAVILFWFLMFALGSLLVLRIIVGICWVNRAFKRFDIVIRPLYPDGVGGLRPLSDFSLRLGLVISIYGIQLGTNQYSTYYIRTGAFGGMMWASDIVIPWMVYVVLGPIVFFAPLIAARHSMRRAKDAQLLFWAERFESSYWALCKEVPQKPATLAGLADEMQEIRRLYTIVSSFPVWPFQAKKLMQFLVTVLLPLIATAAVDIVKNAIVACFVT